MSDEKRVIVYADPQGNIKQSVQEVRKKRLKKDCPCVKCQDWRFDRAVRRKMKEATKQLAKALEVGAYVGAPGNLQGGGPLQVEPLEFRIQPKESSITTPIHIGVKGSK